MAWRGEETQFRVCRPLLVPRAIAFCFGVFSDPCYGEDAGWGDGGYPVQILRREKGGLAVAMQIDFLL